MPIGLPMQRFINIQVSLTALPAEVANFNSLLILGDSNIIDTSERLRSYATIMEVANDFGTSAPEYLAALLFFSQNPVPTQLYIGRWARTATSGLLRGGTLSGADQLLSNFTGITTGAFAISINGSAQTITGMNFSGATNLNGVAAIIQTALRVPATGGYTLATVTWNSQYDQFTITSGTTGASSTVSFLTTPGSGVDISALLKGTAATATYAVAGIVAETALAAVVILDNNPTYWYGLTAATGNNNANITDSDHLAIAAYIEASNAVTGNAHMYGLTTAESSALNSGSSADIGSELMAAGYERSFSQYSSTNPYAVTSIFARFLTVDFTAQNSTLTLMWKTEPGVTPETLNTTQANTLDAKRYNYYVRVNNNTSIIVNGMVAGPAFIDEIFNLDAFANRLQTDLYNLMYTVPTKIPQTDPGEHLIKVTADSSCQAFVNNGFFAPGIWTAATGFGTLKPGDLLPQGYYSYMPPVATQSASDRGARKSTTLQIAGKEAGAVHTVYASVIVNR